jgi:hypothetical protein
MKDTRAEVAAKTCKEFVDVQRGDTLEIFATFKKSRAI